MLKKSVRFGICLLVALNLLSTVSADTATDLTIFNLFKAKFDAARAPRRETLDSDLNVGNDWRCYTIGMSGWGRGSYHGPKVRYNFIRASSGMGGLPFLPFEISSSEENYNLINRTSRSNEARSFEYWNSRFFSERNFRYIEEPATTELRITDNGDLVVRIKLKSYTFPKYVRYNYCARDISHTQNLNNRTKALELISPPPYQSAGS